MDVHVLPSAEDIFDCLHGAMWFLMVDMNSSYHQVDIVEEHKLCTAFTLTLLRLYEFNKLQLHKKE